MKMHKREFTIETDLDGWQPVSAEEILIVADLLKEAEGASEPCE